MFEIFWQWFWLDLMPGNAYLWLWIGFMAWIAIRRYLLDIAEDRRRSEAARLNIPTESRKNGHNPD